MTFKCLNNISEAAYNKTHLETERQKKVRSNIKNKTDDKDACIRTIFKNEKKNTLT